MTVPWELDAEVVADRLVALRTAAAMTQAQTAKAASTSQPAIARYESGRALPSLSTLTKLLAALGMELYLLPRHASDPEHVRLAGKLLELTPAERLDTLRRWARLGDDAVIHEAVLTRPKP